MQPQELPYQTHDGLIWPVQRDKMVQLVAIERRMAEDLNEIRREKSCVTYAMCIERGWTLTQCQKHFQAAAIAAAQQWGRSSTRPMEAA